MKNILILGAGIYQVPLIKTAKRLGLHTIVASVSGNYPGFVLADKAYYTDTCDKEKLLKIAKEEKIDGVCVCGTDVAVPAQGYLCEQLGLIGPSEAAAIRAQNKVDMKKAFIAHDVRTAEVRYIDIENSNVETICQEIGYPVIFKAVDSSGSRGIKCVEDVGQIMTAYEIVRAATHDKQYIIEKYLVGTEFGAQAFVLDGKLQFVLPHGDYVYAGNTGVPLGHFAPIEIGEDKQADAIQQVKKAVRALGLDNCAINADFMLCNGEVYVLEIGARAGATCLVELVSLYYGFDYFQKIIEVSLGLKPNWEQQLETPQPNASMLLYSALGGKIKKICAPAIKDARVLDLSFDYKVGDIIREFTNGTDRIGQIITIGKSVEEAKKVIDDLLEKIEITTEC